MNTKLFAALAGTALVAGAAQADTFVNGSFENGTLAGWTQGGGFWNAAPRPSPIDYLPGGSRYDPSYSAFSVTDAGTDARTDNNLSTVYAGAHSAKINDENPGYGVSVLSQRVNNYSDSQIAFAYAAVLEGSHGPDDSDAFVVTLQDLTQGDTLYNFSLDSATAAGVFTQSSTGWFYSAWTPITVDTSGRLGHDFVLSLTGYDCDLGGHAGYVYLDGFGAITGGGGTGTVPEPATWAMMVGGFGVVGGAMRRRRTAIAFA